MTKKCWWGWGCYHMTYGGWDPSNHHISSRSKRTGTFSYISCHHSCRNFLLYHQNYQTLIFHVLYVAKHFEWNYCFYLNCPERFLFCDHSNEFITGGHSKTDSNLRCIDSLTWCWRCSSQRHEIRSCSLFQLSPTTAGLWSCKLSSSMWGHVGRSEVVAVLPSSYWLCHLQCLCAH